GDQKFVNMRKTFIMGAKGALLIFDLTRRNTLEALDKWRLNFIEIMGEQPMLLIGNKSDLTDHITISNEEAQNYAQKNNLQLIITSAKTGENVEAAFKELVKDIIQIYNQ
ncbi:MAG: GTP-binding protein, partial [Promethearchaeota archaeon]